MRLILQGKQHHPAIQRIKIESEPNFSAVDTWAAVATLLTTARLNDVHPNAWLTGTFERIADGRRLDRAGQTAANANASFSAHSRPEA